MYEQHIVEVIKEIIDMNMSRSIPRVLMKGVAYSDTKVLVYVQVQVYMSTVGRKLLVYKQGFPATSAKSMVRNPPWLFLE